MVNISDKAEDVLKEYFKEKEISPIRIFLQSGGWGGPSLAMVLDEPRNGDRVFDRDGLTFVIAQEFFDRVKPMAVDYVPYIQRIRVLCSLHNL